DKLSNEILSNFAKTEDILSAKLTDLPYLNACIEEGLRMFPPVPGGLPRTVGSNGIVIGNQVIPPDTQISTHTWTIHYDDRYYPEAYTFRPERWLEEDVQLDPLNPFSYGPRACIGRNMAYIEMRMFLAKFVFHFNGDLVNKDEPYGLEDLFISKRRALPIKLSVREH
ncbi:Isotrichodermin C-15 hydroxylase, partial [Neolecta irregularis DAH-3]